MYGWFNYYHQISWAGSDLQAFSQHSDGQFVGNYLGHFCTTHQTLLGFSNNVGGCVHLLSSIQQLRLYGDRTSYVSHQNTGKARLKLVPPALQDKKLHHNMLLRKKSQRCTSQRR